MLGGSSHLPYPSFCDGLLTPEAGHSSIASVRVRVASAELHFSASITISMAVCQLMGSSLAISQPVCQVSFDNFIWFPLLISWSLTL